jgi:hypothetical protein
MLGAASSSGANSSVGAMPAIRCAVADCQTLGARTWTWSGHSWKSAPAATVQAYGITLLFNDPATNHVTLMTQSGSDYGLGIRCVLPAAGAPSTPVNGSNVPSCPVAHPLTTTWTWTGSAWHQVSQVPSTQAEPSFAGAAVAAFAGRVVVLTSAGETWTFAAGQWTQETVAGHPSTRYGAAVGEGPSDTVVLFGGADSFFAVGDSYLGAPVGPTGLVGSDTWVWNGTQWRQDGGRAPSPPPAPSCAALKNGLIPPCVGPPINVAPATAVAPQTAGPVPSPAR